MLSRNIKSLRNIGRTIASFNRTLNNKNKQNGITEVIDNDATETPTNSDINLGNVSTKYRLYKDEESQIIFDVYENVEEEGTDDVTPKDLFKGINLESCSHKENTISSK